VEERELESDFAQVTPSLLRRADELCRRRLARELRGGKRFANKGADMRFAVSNRIEADARLAQAEMGPPRVEAFVEPRDLEPEQRALYRAGVRGYLHEFGGNEARVEAPLFRMELDGLGAELLGSAGLAAECADGTRELRRVVVGGRRPGQALLDEVDVRVALVRTEEFAPDSLRIVATDVIEQHTQVLEPEVASARGEAHDWIAERVVRLLELAEDARPRAGADCQGCAFVSGCTAHG
jgi:hypothetical protein